MHWTIRDAELIAALAKLVEGRPNRGFWMCRKHLRRQGRPWNHKRIYRVYKLMRLNLRRAARRRLPKRERVALYVPRHPDTVWSADFMSDALSCGRRFRLFNVLLRRPSGDVDAAGTGRPTTQLLYPHSGGIARNGGRP